MWWALKTQPLMEKEAPSVPFLRFGSGEKFEVTGQIAPLQLTKKKWSREPLPKKEVKLHSSLASNLLTVDVFLI